MDSRAALQQYFGFDDFRPGQREAVQAVLDGRDALVVMPTGAGKSLCYQLPALMRDELTVVVSPLVSLMADQIAGLQERVGPGVAALINSQQELTGNREALARARGGGLRMLYVAPERFASPGFVEALREAHVGTFVVDEAHCVSQWGHDFRPDYFTLPQAAHAIGARQIVALTATATPRVAGDVMVRLGLRQPARVTTGFDRPGLSYLVVPSTNDEDRRRRVTKVLADPASRPAIVYGGTRARCEELAASFTRDLGIEVLAYHAGLERENRADVQRRFMQGDVDVVVATNAFGMGVDKANVRTVCHVSVPQSLEAYYQEAGRAGRDGHPARCLLFSAARDKSLHVHFIRQSPAGEAQSTRWAQYRAIWAFVEGSGCRRSAIQRHFGDTGTPTVDAGVPCCDVCDPSATPAGPPSARPTVQRAAPAARAELATAIREVVTGANPSVGRTRAVEILRGGRSQLVQRNGYDALPQYGAYAHMTQAQVLAEVDALIEAGALRSTGGRFPKLAAAA